jgi:hypothetical protein
VKPTPTPQPQVKKPSATIKASSVKRKGKLAVALANVADKTTVKVKWESLEKKAKKKNTAAAKKVTVTVKVAGGKLSLKVPAVAGSYRVTLTFGSTKLIVKTVKVK